VIRDRLGRREDRFFATVFLGSGLLFLGMLFVAAATVGAMLAAFGDEPAAFSASPAFRFARAVSSNLVNIYMVKMAGVFMVSTSTVAMATRFAPRWLAGLGYLLAALLVGSSFLRWSFVLFPLWVLILSIHILAGNRGRSAEA
jgi:hypothetical protein